jgi:hypothetical protein
MYAACDNFQQLSIYKLRSTTEKMLTLVYNIVKAAKKGDGLSIRFFEAERHTHRYKVN